ncbi:MAG: hypothetical protein F6K19_47175, partial [Cyanothece sp. SIO1E1]|nr:hypothetical protein [Cyanothece sp. SIO1E1]
VRLQRLQSPPYAPGATRTAIAPITPISRIEVDVEDFQLIWNGQTFHLTWTEVEGTNLRHLQTMLTRHGSRATYSLPSAALLKATLINGATNIGNTNLPNLNQLSTAAGAFDQRDGYGWGRVNLRQSLSPSPPVTFQVRDNNTLGPGRTARYRFDLPPNTALLRVTLSWTDPPGARLVNNLHLRITTPANPTRQVYIGNTWQGNTGQSRPFAGGDRFDNTHPIEQIVLNNPPAGIYDVEAIAEPFPTNAFNQFRAQSFALVFVGSGPEVRFGNIIPTPLPFY